MKRWAISSGGILTEKKKILLVKVTYGACQGKWLLPGGYVNPGESIEEATEREFQEETGIIVKTKSLVSVRSGVQEKEGTKYTSIYCIFNVEKIAGELTIDGQEIDDAKYWEYHDVLTSEQVLAFTKAVIHQSYHNEHHTLRIGPQITPNHTYSFYRYYVPNTTE